MPKYRKAIILIIAIAIIGSFFAVVFAVSNAHTEEMTTMNPFEYATTPEGVYVFIYHGSSPYPSLNIDTAECVANRLYVYNSANNSLVAISEQVVTAYTYTQTALYYVTEDQKIYKTDRWNNLKEVCI